MFVKGEDFYFLSYNIIILLKELGCFGTPRKFKDARKLALLTEFVADRNLIDILNRSLAMRSRNNNERRYMVNAYSEGLVRVKLITRLLFALEQRGIVSLEKDSSRNTISIWLNKEVIPDNFFDKNLFKEEVRNIESLRNLVHGITNLTYDTLKEKLFGNYDIHTWDI